jgi:hypothetical protein
MERSDIFGKDERVIFNFQSSGVMRTKRRIVIFGGVVLMILLSWVFYNALQPPVLPVGALLPHLPCITCEGIDTLRTNGPHGTLIMLFSTRCPHCLYELDVFDKNYSALSHIQIYLVTTDPGFQLCKDSMRWFNLFTADRVVWARITEYDFIRHFGSAISPAMFIFDAHGILKSKIRGEVKLAKMLALVGKFKTSFDD